MSGQIHWLFRAAPAREDRYLCDTSASERNTDLAIVLRPVLSSKRHRECHNCAVISQTLGIPQNEQPSSEGAKSGPSPSDRSLQRINAVYALLLWHISEAHSEERRDMLDAARLTLIQLEPTPALEPPVLHAHRHAIEALIMLATLEESTRACGPVDPARFQQARNHLLEAISELRHANICATASAIGQRALGSTLFGANTAKDTPSQGHTPLLDRTRPKIVGCTCGWRTPAGITDSDHAYTAHAAANLTKPAEMPKGPS